MARPCCLISQNGGSLFYVRAYGPAILPGLVMDHRNGTYDVILHPMDEGIYTVEVVLTYFNPPPFSDFPMREILLSQLTKDTCFHLFR
jgi:hypothetical protein